ncbi:fibronectin type III domain-containing protein [bacterium]|nr:fibronectin type III domain-containing protein [bacterium]
MLSNPSTRDISCTTITTCLVFIGMFCLLPLTAVQAGSPLPDGPDETSSLTDRHADRLPVCFTENRGQIVDTDGRLRPEILYSADAGTARLYFTSAGVSYVFQESATEAEGQFGPVVNAVSALNRPTVPHAPELSAYRMDMKLVGSNPLVRIRAEQALPAYSNYYYPHCPQGITHVRSFARIVYENVYDNIDMVFAAAQGKTKYEFIVRPGGDPAQIRLRYDGAVSMRHAENGRLSIATPVGEIDEQSPYSYQLTGKDVPTAFVLRGEEVTFDVGAYDASKTLVIDPWATYYGGHGTDQASGVAIDASGNVIVCGTTASTDFPVIGAAQGTHAGSNDIAIVKFSDAGTPVWATYYGGTQDDWGLDVAVDASGNIAVTGSVTSWDFPVKNAMQQTIGSQGTDDAFVLLLDGGGSCQWATYHGGALSDYSQGIAFDGSGNVVLTGTTESDNFPVQNAWQSTKQQMEEAFLSKLSFNGTLLWSTFVGGERDDRGRDVTVDASGNIYLVGATGSQYFPVLNPFQSAIGGVGADDAFIARFSGAGVPDWLTYYGGTSGDGAFTVTSDGSGNVIVAGLTTSSDFPVSGAEQPYISGGGDVFILKLTSGGSRTWATYFGGSGAEGIGGIATDGNDNILFTGFTLSGNLPVANPWQSNYGGSGDGFVVKFDALGRKQWATYLGGDRYDMGKSIDTDGSGNVILCGQTASLDFPVYKAHQPALSAVQSGDDWTGYDMFIASMSPDGIIIPLYKPATPTSLTASTLSPTKVMLRWTDNADNESEYIIERQKDASPWEEAAADTMNATQHTLIGLQPEALYTFRVKAVNWVFESDYSDEVQITMPEFKAPTELKVADISSSEIGLVWVDHADNETDYVVELKNGGDWRPVDTLRENTTAATVTELTPQTPYSFRVLAMDGAIASAYSNEVQATTLRFLDAPAALTASLLTENSAHLEWTDHSTEETGYEVEQRIKYGSWTLITTTAADVTTFDVVGLIADTTYAFRVRAVGQDATSSYSNEVSIFTSLAPATPINLIADARDLFTVQVTWERASTNEDYFEIERSEDGATWTPVHTTTAGITVLNDEHLEPSTVYWYRVRAVNATGVSGWSAADSARTYARPAPGRPFFPAATTLDAHAIEITWVLPHPSYEDGCEIQESTTGDDADFTTIEPAIAPGKRSYERTGLNPLTTYYYRIRAYNGSGTSEWSDVVSAMTLEENLDLPPVPTNVHARTLGTSEIRITWEMPSPSNEDSFEIERSETADVADFHLLTSNLAAGDSSYTDSGLPSESEYWYRVRARNVDGTSRWSTVVSAKTDRAPMGQELRDAIAAKEAMFPACEELISNGSPELAILRQVFTDYQRGYDEAAARSLIAKWQTGYPADQSAAAEAFTRFAFLERVLSGGFEDLSYSPPIEGAVATAKQAATPIGMMLKNVCALGFAWQDQRTYLGAEDQVVDAVLVDMINPVYDGAFLMMQLMGMTPDAAVPEFYTTLLRERGEIPDLTKPALTSMVDYWGECILGSCYLPVTQPFIPLFADRTEQLDFTGNTQSAIAKRDIALQSVRTETESLQTDFTSYGSVCTGMDAAYALGQASGTPLEAFFLKLRDLRPRMVDRLYDAIAAAATPVARMLYLASTEKVPGLGSLPSLIREAGNAIFDPVNNSVQSANGSVPGGRSRNDVGFPLSAHGISKTGRLLMSGAVSSDRASLSELRGRVADEDTAFINEHFDALRHSGMDMIAETSLLQRPLLGIAPADLYVQQDLRDDYYVVLARMQLLAMRRAVLSVSLMDYFHSPTADRKANLLAEIDSILIPLEGSVDAITDLTTDVGSLITLPALGVVETEIVRAPSSGENSCNLRLTTENMGGAAAQDVAATVAILSSGVTMKTGNILPLGLLPPDGSAQGSLEIDVLPTTKHVTIFVVLEAGKRRFIDRRTLPVPASTTAVEEPAAMPTSHQLHQNYPNPFNPTTTISYTLSRPVEVSLIVTDALGREVTRLIDEEKRRSGLHTTRFNARDLPSGVYFYRLETPDGVFVRKMQFVR